MTGSQASALAELIDQLVEANVAYALAKHDVTKCDATEKSVLGYNCDLAKENLTDALRRVESTR